MTKKLQEIYEKEYAPRIKALINEMLKRGFSPIVIINYNNGGSWTFTGGLNGNILTLGPTFILALCMLNEDLMKKFAPFILDMGSEIFKNFLEYVEEISGIKASEPIRKEQS